MISDIGACVPVANEAGGVVAAGLGELGLTGLGELELATGSDDELGELELRGGGGAEGLGDAAIAAGDGDGPSRVAHRPSPEHLCRKRAQGAQNAEPTKSSGGSAEVEGEHGTP